MFEGCTVASLLGAGGDERLRIDPATGLNRYLVGPRPASGIALASCTASPLGAHGHAAASALLARLRAGGKTTLADARAELTARVLAAWRAEGVARAWLTPSGTDAALWAVGAATRGAQAASVMPGLAETGAGVPMAAAGRHFADGPNAGGTSVRRGETVPGFAPSMPVVPVAMRDEAGAMLPADTVAASCEAATERLAAEHPGAVLLLHALHGSKTGLVAPGEATCAHLAGCWPGRLVVVVDACQARLPAASVRSMLARGWPVLVTGSKAWGGPPFCGAVLWPLALGPPAWPAGLAAYRADALGTAGMLARWAAALAEHEAGLAFDDPAAAPALARIGRSVRASVASSPGLRLAGGGESRGIWTIAAPGLGLEALRAVHRALAAEGCLLGQPVALGDAGAAGLRVAVSERQMADPAATAAEAAEAVHRLASALRRSPWAAAADIAILG